MEPPPRMSPMEYWGNLITDQHPPQPTPLFRGLLSGIAEYVIDNMEPKDVKCLTPQKISAFYRAVGGSDLDELFLGTPSPRLSEIYTTLGCAHSLQPVPGDDFLPPSIPALTPRGFVIWQTVQLLMEPGEHVPYIRTAVSEFPLRDPATGEYFPREIPLESFPKYPNKETLDWHDDAFNRLTAEKAKKKEEERVAESTVGGVPSHPGTSARATFDSSDNEEWNYRSKRRHASGGDRRRHTAHQPYEDYDRYSKSAPGSGREERERSAHRHDYGGYSHKHHHSYSHPTSAPRYEVKAETPLDSDIDDEYSSPRYSRPQSHSRTRNHPHRHSHPSHSRSREFPKTKGYVYANGDAVPVYTEVPPPEPQLPTYHHQPPPPQPSLHAFQSFPNLHTQHPPEPVPHDDLRSRFLRHRSSSPATRAPLGGGGIGVVEGVGGRHRHRHRTGEGLRAQYYQEDEAYEEPMVGATGYDDESEEDVGWNLANERLRHEEEERMRRKPPAKVRSRGVHETVYVQGDVEASWGGRHGASARRGTVPVVYYG